MNKGITIFTPTYNRAHTLEKCYKSLCQQTSQEFVWLIVDDGSKDSTSELIEKWTEEGIINISYCFQENGGKHVAFNKGVTLCKTELFYCVDSDDWLPENAVKEILDFWTGITDVQIAGIVGKKDMHGPGSTTSLSEIDSCTLYELYDKYGVKGDTALIFRVEILKDHPFPIIQGEKFVTEALVYDQIDQKYRLATCDKVLYCGNYMNDGLTRNAFYLHVNNPQGFIMYYTQRYKIAHSLALQYKYMTMYVLYNGLAGNLLKGIIEAPSRMMAIFAMPSALIVWLWRYSRI